MPPKKNEPPPPPVSVVPPLEELVQLPEELAELPEPSFCLVLGHLFGHQFVVQPPLKPAIDAGGAGEPQEEIGPPQPFDFDPCARLLARAKETEDPLAKSVVVVEREDLQAVAQAEEKSLPSVLRQRVEKERAARRMAKINRARRRAIEALEAARAPKEEGEEEQAEAPPEESPLAVALAAGQEDGPGPKADFLLWLKDYPATAAELQELAAEGLCSDGHADLWAAVYLAGETLEEEQEDGADRGRVACEPPEPVRLFHRAILAAPAGSELADFTICTHRDSHTLALQEDGGGQVDQIQAAVLAMLTSEVEAKKRYTQWLQAPSRVQVPSIGMQDAQVETRLYQRMMGSVDPSHHDIPLFLHCLTSQVERTLDGGAQQEEDSLALSGLQDYFGTALDGVVTAGGDGAPRPPSRQGAATEAEQAAAGPGGDEGGDGGVTLPCHDLAACAHHVGGGGGAASRILGSEPVIEAVQRVLAEVRAPGVKRLGLPKDAVLSTAQREALQGRIYPFAPEVPPAELEQMLLVHAFESLLTKAQPERSWCLMDRRFHELVPRELLAQVLEDALHFEPLVDTAYLPRHDCLLLALHHRSPPGQVMWHSWKGDLLLEAESERWQRGLFTVPTYNDWSQVFGAGAAICLDPAKVPQPQVLLEGFDARRYGYGGVVEKVAAPADGSVILVTKLEMGLKYAFPAPTNAIPSVNMDDMATAIDGEGTLYDGAESSATTEATTVVTKGGLGDVPAGPTRWDAPAASLSRLARVMKGGLTFGLVADTPWERWRQVQRDRAVRQAEAAAAAGVAAQAAEGDADGSKTGSRPVSPPDAVQASLQEAEVELPFRDTELGVLWVALPGGARCTARMHHERVLPKELELGGGAAAEPLPAMGVLLTYTMAAGQVVQVFSDGAVQLSWPLALRDGVDAPASAAAGGATADAAASRADSGRLPSSAGAPHFEPGCPEDVETSRTVTPFGTLVRRLRSGRVEVCHADGTTASRNPTAAELRRRLEELRAEPAGVDGGAQLELLERLCQVYKERHERPMTEPPSQRAKAAGLPGHWVVVRPDGRMFGRAPVLECQTPTNTPAPAGDLPEQPGNDPRASVTSVMSGGAANSVEPVEATEPPPLQELLGGVFIDGGAAIEYDINPVSQALQVDLQSKHKTFTNARGLASFEDPEAIQKVSTHKDGTQLMRTHSTGGYEVSVSKEPLAHVRCKVDTSPGDAGMLVVVECADGARIEVVPQTMGTGLADPMPLLPDAEELLGLATHASAVLECRSGARVVSTGCGQVDVFTSPGDRGYTALCNEGRLMLRDREGVEFELRSDQQLSISGLTGGGGGLLSFTGAADPWEQPMSPGSPRCLLPAKAYRSPDSDGLQPPEYVPPPRLFVVYGDGEAAELVAADDALKMLQDAEADPLSSVSEGDPPGQMETCRSYTVFRTRLPDTNVLPPPATVALPEASETSGMSASSLKLAVPQKPSPAPVTEYRRLLEYPPITHEVRAQFHGTLKQYRQWEAEQLAKRRAAAQGPEVKGKSGAKKEKKAGDKKEEAREKRRSERRKRGRSFAANVEVVEVIEAPADPAFVQDLRLTAYEHLVQVLRLRAGGEGGGELAEAGVAEDAEGEGLGGDASETVASLPPSPARQLSPKVGAAVASIPSTPQGSSADAHTGEAEAAALGADSGSGDEPQPPPAAEKPARRPKVAEAEFSFSYFKSEMGLQYLAESGELERSTPIQKASERTGGSSSSQRPPPAPSRRSPWNPRLVGEPEEEDRQRQLEETQEEEPTQYFPRPSMANSPLSVDQTAQAERTFDPAPRLPMVPERVEAPSGPHPGKKGASWDVYGEPRPQRPQVSQAHVEINTQFLEVEGATDRRVRTCSIVHKKNAAKAPSVSSVRKTGTHALGRGTELGAQDILGNLTTAEPQQHWKLTSTMQGLGDSNNLVEVTPGNCRFGTLRSGSLYRMNFSIRNLDVDGTRFNVVPVKSEFVRVTHSPGHLAPGMATRIAVEIAAFSPAKIEQLVEVKMKAHVVRVPVTAVIYDAEEYDRLDAESLAINGRRIGRHRERDEGNQLGPVELVRDEGYCRRIMGAAYQPQPADYDTEEHDQGSTPHLSAVP